VPQNRPTDRERFSAAENVAAKRQIQSKQRDADAKNLNICVKLYKINIE
jgi:hypothetical protein